MRPRDFRKTTSDTRRAMASAILCPDPRPAPGERISRYFGPPRLPGTMAIGEGGPELVKQLLKRTYDIAYPEVW